jgi:hypothetical protein
MKAGTGARSFSRLEEDSWPALARSRDSNRRSFCGGEEFGQPIVLAAPANQLRAKRLIRPGRPEGLF